jgi:hypothetical protein
MWQLMGSTQIAPGKTVRHGYWWGGPSKGPQMALACPNTKIETWSNHVNTVKQGFRNGNNGCVYTVDVSCEDVFGTGGFGTYEVWVQGWS